MPIERTVSYSVGMSRLHSQPDWVEVRLRKHFWSVSTGSRSRGVAVTGFYAQGMGERDILDAALRELLRALNDDLA